MTPEQQRIVIAEACGWESETWFENGGDGHTTEPPHYPDDLNAMHEAEKMLTPNQYHNYAVRLHELAISNPEYKMHMCYWACRATASQRAEAFLRTIGKWES